MEGLHLNAFPVEFAGRLTMWLVPGRDEARQDGFRERLGVPAFRNDRGWWSVTEPAVPAEQVQMRAAPVDDLRLFAARGALLAHLRRRGCDAWGAKGEVRAVGLLPAEDVGPFVAEPQLLARFAAEEWLDAPAVLLARRRTRWTWSGNLTEPRLRQYAPGTRAVRLSGDGPSSGTVVRADPDALLLRLSGNETVVDPSDYTLVVGSSAARALGGPDSLRQLQVASGSLTRRGTKDPNGVKTRFGAVDALLAAVGGHVPLQGGDGGLTISPEPVGLGDAP